MTQTQEDVIGCWVCDTTIPEAEALRCPFCGYNVCTGCWNARDDGCTNCTMFECYRCEGDFRTEQRNYCQCCENYYCEECYGYDYCTNCEPTVVRERLYEVIAETKYEAEHEKFYEWAKEQYGISDLITYDEKSNIGVYKDWLQHTGRNIENKNGCSGSVELVLEVEP